MAVRRPAAAARVCGSASSGVRIGRTRSAASATAPARTAKATGARRAGGVQSRVVGEGRVRDQPDEPEQVGEQEAGERDQDALGRPEQRLADPPVGAVLAQPGVPGGQQRRQQEGDREQREGPAGHEVAADPDVVLGSGGGRVGVVEGEDQVEHRAPGGGQRLRRDRLGDVVAGGNAALAVGADRERLDPGPPQGDLLAEAGWEGEPREPDPGAGGRIPLLELGRRDVAGRLHELGRGGVGPRTRADHEGGLRLGDARLGDHERLVDDPGIGEGVDELVGSLGSVAAAVGRREDQRPVAARVPEVVGERQQRRRRRRARRRALSLGGVAGGEDEDRSRRRRPAGSG